MADLGDTALLRPVGRYFDYLVVPNNIGDKAFCDRDHTVPHGGLHLLEVCCPATLRDFGRKHRFIFVISDEELEPPQIQ